MLMLKGLHDLSLTIHDFQVDTRAVYDFDSHVYSCARMVAQVDSGHTVLLEGMNQSVGPDMSL
jgi:hypothetical protein